MARVRDYVYDTREAALEAGWDDAEYGWWVPANGDTSKARWGWIALESARDQPTIAIVVNENMH